MDEATFCRLLDAHRGALLRVSRSYAATAADAEDLYQEIVAALWSSRASFRGESAPGTWLYRVALNVAITLRRRDRRRPALADGAAVPERGSHGDPRDPATILADFLDTLGEVDRSILLMYMEGLAQEEIADVTGLRVTTVGVRIHRMKRAFSNRYVED